jgi:glucose-6-phosphate dehydrogenase assembly protein OpcA
MAELVQTSAPHLMDADAIEKALVELWQQVGKSERPMMRARVLNLLIVTRESRESEMAELMIRLAQRHPARNLLLLLGDEEGAGEFDASATLLCGMHGRALCTEQICLRASGTARDRLPSAVRSLLADSLPVALWWTLPVTEERTLLDKLCRLADHIYVDSATLDEVEGLEEFAAPWLRRCTSDLNWGRLGAWRDIIARFFDPPALRDLVDHIDRVEIETGQQDLGGWLLAGWLASRLGWEILEATEQSARYRRQEDGEVVQVRLRTRKGAHSIYGIAIEAGDASFRAERVDTTAVRCIAELPGLPCMEQVGRLDDEQDVTLLAHELDLMDEDLSYREALAAVNVAVEMR